MARPVDWQGWRGQWGPPGSASPLAPVPMRPAAWWPRGAGCCLGWSWLTSLGLVLEVSSLAATLPAKAVVGPPGFRV